MITAAISAIVGLVSGVLPEIVKEVRDTRNQQREIDFLKVQHELQMERERVGAENKVREAQAVTMGEELRAFRETLGAIIESQSKPTGIVWIDGFNAVLRPATALLMVVLFGWTSVIFLNGVMDAWTAGKIASEAKLAELVWGSMLGEAILATLGFLFGYRSVRKGGAS